MNDIVVLPLAALLLVGIAGSLAASRLTPRMGALTHAVLLSSVLFATVPTLWLVGLSGIAHTSLHNPAVDWTYHLLPEHTVASVMVGIASLVAAVVGTARAVKVVALHWRLRCVDTPPLHLVESDEPFAYTLPGPAGTVTVSSGLRDRLTDAEYDLVLAHEQAHATHRHDRFKLLGLLTTAFLPPMRSAARRVDHLLERWADEEAIERTGADRRLAARTIAKVALAGAPAGALGYGGAGAAARAAAVLEPRPPSVMTRLQAGHLLMGTIALALYQLHHSAVFAHHLVA